MPEPPANAMVVSGPFSSFHPTPPREPRQRHEQPLACAHALLRVQRDLHDRLPVRRRSEVLHEPCIVLAQERIALERTYQEAGGNLTRAAELFGVPRTTYREKLVRHGLLEH